MCSQCCGQSHARAALTLDGLKRRLHLSKNLPVPLI